MVLTKKYKNFKILNFRKILLKLMDFIKVILYIFHDLLKNLAINLNKYLIF